MKVLVAQSCLTLCNHGLQPTMLFCLWNSPGNNVGVGCHSLLQGISPTQGWTLVSCIAGRFFTIWVTREATREALQHIIIIGLNNEYFFSFYLFDNIFSYFLLVWPPPWWISHFCLFINSFLKFFEDSVYHEYN